MIKIKGVRALDELAGSNKGKIRLLSRADEKRYSKGKREGSRHRAERVSIVNKMTIEEARNTEVGITKTGRGRYGNAHIRYDINDGLVDILLEVTPTEEEKAERIKEQKEQESKRRMAKEKEHEIQEKYRPSEGESA
jgi:VIT1/CCC1 family predicted Fe2+/Mn2+ transporter